MEPALPPPHGANTPVAVLGLGTMGAALARALLDSGHPTTVWNRTAGKDDDLVARGATRADTAAQAAASSPFVIVCVTNHDAVRDIHHQIGDSLSGRVLVNLTTTTPAQAREAATWTAERGASFLDGAVQAGAGAIGTAEALLLVSGPREVFDTHADTLRALGTVTHVGAGAELASLHDLALLGVWYEASAGYLHALALVAAAGADTSVLTTHAAGMLTAVAGSAADTAREMREHVYPEGPAPLSEHRTVVGHLIETSRDYGVDARRLLPVKELIDRRVAEGNGGDGFTGLVEELGSLAGSDPAPSDEPGESARGKGEPPSRDTGHGWEPAPLDLDAYLRRIGYDGPLDPTLETLRALQWAHAATIPFANATVQLDGLPALDLASLQERLVHGSRGGYCYEQNILFGTVLDRLGFRVTGLRARILMGADADTLRADGHAVLRVDVAGRSWLVDVGVGGIGPLEPVELAEGTEVTSGGWTYRMDRTADGMWLLRHLAADGWENVYKFTLAPAYRVDYEDDNYIAAYHPRSPFSRGLIAQRNGPHVRYTVNGLELSVTRPGEQRETRELDPGELPDVLRDTFGLELTGEQHQELVRIAGSGSEAGRAASLQG